MRNGVANLVFVRALVVLPTAAQTITGSVVAVGQPAAVHTIRTAVAGIQARADLADIAAGARGAAIPARVRITLCVHTACFAQLEARRADAIVDTGVAGLIVAGALLALGASRQALAAALFTIGEPAAASGVRAAVAGIGAIPRIADVPDGTGGAAIAAVPWVSLGVHAVETADGERGPADDPAAVGYAAIRDRDAGVGRQDTRVVDALQIFGVHHLVNAGGDGAGQSASAATGLPGGTIHARTSAVQRNLDQPGFAADEPRLDAARDQNSITTVRERLELDHNLAVEVGVVGQDAKCCGQRMDARFARRLVGYCEHADPGLDLFWAGLRLHDLGNACPNAVHLHRHPVVGVHEDDDLRGRALGATHPKE